jgi:hypothetical protein
MCHFQGGTSFRHKALRSQHNLPAIPIPASSRHHLKLTDKNMSDYVIPEACFGFSAPEDRVVSLNIPLAVEDGQNSSYHSFDIEYDSEQPSNLTIRLLELDQHGFIRTALQSASFPAALLADLVSKRKATDAEIAEWKSIADED